MKRLTANKAKMLRLCREYGMAPKNALFTKVYRSQTWWLEWIDVQDSAQSGIWKVTFTACAGKPMLTITHDRKDEVKVIPMDLLEKLGMIDTETMEVSQWN